MKADRITGKSKTSEIPYSEIQKLAKKKNITPEAAKKELMKKYTKKK